MHGVERDEAFAPVVAKVGQTPVHIAERLPLVDKFEGLGSRNLGLELIAICEKQMIQVFARLFATQHSMVRDDTDVPLPQDT
jgi:hypothetical protein